MSDSVSREAYELVVSRLTHLEGRVCVLEQSQSQLAPAVEEHDDRLDEHDVQIGSISNKLTIMVSEQHRLADALTMLQAGLPAIARQLAAIAERLGVKQ